MTKHRMLPPPLGGLLIAAGATCLALSPRLLAQAKLPRANAAAEPITLRNSGGQSVATYHLRAPGDPALPVDSGGFFHPVTTPAGIPVTDLAPSDHKHHRGVFLGWVEMHGAKDADFWGWGEHAPVNDRRIVNRSLAPLPNGKTGPGFVAINDWQAENLVLLVEELRATARTETAANILDLVYTLTPQADLALSRWAFSGFCVRVRKDAELLAVHSPAGPVLLPNPGHLKPESDWPDAPWYACEQRLSGGKVFGTAVLNHSKNMEALWHNHRDVRMLNPCIVAPREVRLKGAQPLVLRYRVVAFDGPVPADLLNRLAKEWSDKTGEDAK